MIENIEKTSHWSQYVKDGASDSNLLKEAFTQAFLNIDVTLRTFQGENSRDTSGCTSVTAMITPKFIICANAGDSRCVMGTNNTAKAMSEDHKPNDELEQKRIEAAGGRVQWKRVDGDLAVSRGLGDFHYKNRSDLTQGEQKVIDKLNCQLFSSLLSNHRIDCVLEAVSFRPRYFQFIQHLTS